MKIDPSKLKTRPLNPEKDLNFILSTWLKSNKSSEFARCIPNEVYFPRHQHIIGSILKHPTNNVTILCNPDDEDQIIGYIVYSTVEPIIFYTYIKYPFRKFGFGTYLFEGIKTHFREISESDNPTVACTHKAKRWAKISKAFNLVYNPYIIGG